MYFLYQYIIYLEHEDYFGYVSTHLINNLNSRQEAYHVTVDNSKFYINSAVSKCNSFVLAFTGGVFLRYSQARSSLSPLSKYYSNTMAAYDLFAFSMGS